MVTTIKITGMHCASCKTLIEEVCGESSGVSSCIVDAKTGQGVIEHDERFDFAALSKEIAGLGGYRIEKI